MNILISGYPYIRENYFNTLRSYPEKDKLFFLLPKEWKVKGGKVVYYPPEDSNITKTKAYFYHSDYPVAGGLFKGWMPSFPFVLWQLKRRKKIKIVYSTSEPILLTTLYQGFWSKLFGLKHAIFTWENVSYDRKFKGLNLLFKKIIIKLNLWLSDGVVCGNKKAESIMREYTQKPLAVIPMSGTDDNFFKPGLTEKKFQGYDLNSKVVYSFVGSMSYRKGIHLIIESYKKVLDRIPDSFLILAGSGEYEGEIDRLIRDNGLSSHIVRLPWVSHQELVQILSVSDIFLYPSFHYKGWEEQFGYSMAEASLMELPVISTLSGSTEEVVVNGVTGLLVKPNDQGSLEEAMVKLGLNRELGKEMGKAGRRYITENFSNKAVAEKLYEFFKKINLHS